jgi:hypothetical protein
MTWCPRADVARNLTFDETALISPDKNGIIHSSNAYRRCWWCRNGFLSLRFLMHETIGIDPDIR